MSAPDLTNDVRRQIARNPPRLRGVLHLAMVPVAIVSAVFAVLQAPPQLPRVLVGIYGSTLLAMYSFSAAFHRIQWSDRGWWRMRQLDHTGIYLVIAGSFTGIAGLSLDGVSRAVMLVVVWGVAALGITYRWSPVVPPFGLTTGLFVVLAACVIPFLPRMIDSLGRSGVAIMLFGCIVYLVGALLLGIRRPDPWPTVFGYHEVWHVVVVIGSVLHYVVLVRYAIPASEALQAAGSVG